MISREDSFNGSKSNFQLLKDRESSSLLTIFTLEANTKVKKSSNFGLTNTPFNLQELWKDFQIK
jgi:hypothetical protein